VSLVVKDSWRRAGIVISEYILLVHGPFDESSSEYCHKGSDRADGRSGRRNATVVHAYRRRTSPNLERLASRGTRFDQAFATAPWTLPSHSSLFTGRWPHELTADWQSPLDRTHPTLAEYLAGHGYDTAGFVANLDYCSRETGLSRGLCALRRFSDRALGCDDPLRRNW
jgi:hypothetical protein